MLPASIGIVLASLLCVRGARLPGCCPYRNNATHGRTTRKPCSPTPRFTGTPFGVLLQRDQLLAHHEEVSEGEECEASASEKGGGRRDGETHHQPASASAAWLDDIADGEPTEDPLSMWQDHAGYVAILLELDELENEELLARLQMLGFRCQGSRAAATGIVDPIVPVRRHLELAQPAEHNLRRRLDLHGAREALAGALDIAVAGVLGAPRSAAVAFQY